jgi:hypothetical protein
MNKISSLFGRPSTLSGDPRENRKQIDHLKDVRKTASSHYIASLSMNDDYNRWTKPQSDNQREEELASRIILLSKPSMRQL